MIYKNLLLKMVLNIAKTKTNIIQLPRINLSNLNNCSGGGKL